MKVPPAVAFGGRFFINIFLFCFSMPYSVIPSSFVVFCHPEQRGGPFAVAQGNIGCFAKLNMTRCMHNKTKRLRNKKKPSFRSASVIPKHLRHSERSEESFPSRNCP